MTPEERKMRWERLIRRSREFYFPGSKDLTGIYKLERLDPYHLPTTKLNPLMRKYHQSITPPPPTTSTTAIERSFHAFIAWLAEQRASEQQKNGARYKAPLGVTYLDEAGREPYKITFSGTKIVFSQIANDSGMSSYDGEIIFAVDGKNNFFFGVKDIGRFHHSSMLSGAPVAGAGTMKINQCEIVEVNNHSGHYKPGLYEMQRVVVAMNSRGADVYRIHLVVDDLPQQGRFDGMAREFLFYKKK